MRRIALMLLLAAAVRAGDANPGPVRSSGLAVGGKTPLRVGQVLQVEWGMSWWTGEILAIGKDGRIRIHYVGWAASWDEWVTRDRLQLAAKGEQGKKDRRKQGQKNQPERERKKEKETIWQPGPIRSSGLKIDAQTQIEVGQLVQVRFGDAWWGGKVLELFGDGRVKIRYVGWGSSWDTVVGRDRLQLDTNPPTVLGHPPLR